ncbi:rhodanese-like domain-containing protein [Pseudomonas gingeri]|uniref:rhodanese-like domain-containing protein n=1 Tax=Pseudomonas gingeri TaxID=117681 RepID=UPI0015A325BA|nr:rhodanese-like domain-containing protein [Pseudomonas gingeri]NVZ99978.1 rhodanese-like domain-containing protein [Pseudomonas gingeri]NWA16818.1 rhodanese-like domain-containing protein [Pseudomonas gingeri]NWA53796.1 rhodanese-like domain-containing protein [Pseudomonas gingeri]NWA94028.1 rhodanese-like domain-containing protein [Pseudomonas gingeri]NWB02072.1 rhodanese-like domain-containing protein [Pseudomonas gingeri]
MRHWIVAAAVAATLLSSLCARAGIIDVNRAVDEIRDGALILDLRNNSDFAAGNIHNSLQVDLTLENGTGISAEGLAYQLRLVVLDPNATVVIYSDTDQHALEAEDTLIRRGYFGIVNGGNYSELRDALFDHVEDTPTWAFDNDDDIADQATPTAVPSE